MSVSCFESVPEWLLWQQQGRSRGREPCMGVGAIVDGGDMPSMCTMKSELWLFVQIICHKSCALVVFDRGLVAIKSTLIMFCAQVPFPRSAPWMPPTHTHTQFFLTILTPADVWGTITRKESECECCRLKRGLFFSSPERVTILTIGNLWCSYLLPPRSTPPSVCPSFPLSERHQVAIATARLWETEIRSSWTMGSRNWRTFLFSPSVNTGSGNAWSLSSVPNTQSSIE